MTDKVNANAKTPEDVFDAIIAEMGSQETPNPSLQDPNKPTSKTATTDNRLSEAATPEFFIERSKVLRPYVGLVYGCPGVGKTTLCSSIPNSLVIDLERGGDGMDCTRITIEDQESPRATIAKIKRAIAFGVNEGFTTIIIDSITTLSQLFERQYLLENQKTALDADFGRDYDKLNTLIKEFLGGQTAKTGVMQYLKSKSCNLILVGHEKEKIDNVGDSKLIHSTFPNLYKGMVSWLNVQCDFIFYYTFDIIVREEQLGMTKERLSATRGRKLITTQEGGIMAKNRFDFIKPVISNPTYRVFTSIFDSWVKHPKDNKQIE